MELEVGVLMFVTFSWFCSGESSGVNIGGFGHVGQFTLVICGGVE